MKKILIILTTTVAGALIFPATALAHCPLCTAGAGLVALGAYWFGVKAIVIGIAIGAFAAAMGLWFGHLPKRQYIPHQAKIIAVVVWFFTIFPIRMLFADYYSWYLNWGGGYGSVFNRTYAINLFLVGAALGTIILLAAPSISQLCSRLRGGRKIPFQGMLAALFMVIAAMVIVQIL